LIIKEILKLIAMHLFLKVLNGRGIKKKRRKNEKSLSPEKRKQYSHIPLDFTLSEGGGVHLNCQGIAGLRGLEKNREEEFK